MPAEDLLSFWDSIAFQQSPNKTSGLVTEIANKRSRWHSPTPPATCAAGEARQMPGVSSCHEHPLPASRYGELKGTPHITQAGPLPKQGPSEQSIQFKPAPMEASRGTVHRTSSATRSVCLIHKTIRKRELIPSFNFEI